MNYQQYHDSMEIPCDMTGILASIISSFLVEGLEQFIPSQGLYSGG